MTQKKSLIVPITIICIVIIGYFTIDFFLFDGVKPTSVNESGFQGTLYVKDGLKNKTAIILLGGGPWGAYWAQEFATNDMVGFSLPYIGSAGLPTLPEDIDLAYFENAIQWLGKQQEVNPDKVLVMGASRNAELALVIASTLPEIVSGVIAYAPSSVSWSNTVLPYNSNTLKPSWTYNDMDIPYVPMKKISGNDSNKINMLAYWEEGLANTDVVNNAIIKVERIAGPVVLFSGLDDKVWPSAKMADMIAKRLKENDFKYPVKNIQYENAGHLISSNPAQKSNERIGTIGIDGKKYEYLYGGTTEGDFKAKKDAKTHLIQFLSDI